MPAYALPGRTKAANQPGVRAFPMPHFSFWAWSRRTVGSYARVAAAVDAVEAALPLFHHKDPRPVWRGTTRLQGAQSPDVTAALLKATEGAPWADIQELCGSSSNST